MLQHCKTSCVIHILLAEVASPFTQRVRRKVNEMQKEGARETVCSWHSGSYVIK